MNAIKFAGSTDELTSSFCQRNQELCKDWEQYILDHNGKVNGKYTAWALILKGKVKLKHTWVFKLERAIVTPPITPTTNYDNLVRKTEIHGVGIPMGDFDFKIQKYKLRHSVQMLFDSNLYRLNENLIIKIKEGEAKRIESFISLMVEMDEKFGVERVSYNHKKKQLYIEFNALVNDFNCIDRIIS